jgi:hypothetical protein
VIGAAIDKEIRSIFYGTPLILAIEILDVLWGFACKARTNSP